MKYLGPFVLGAVITVGSLAWFQMSVSPPPAKPVAVDKNPIDPVLLAGELTVPTRSIPAPIDDAFVPNKPVRQIDMPRTPEAEVATIEPETGAEAADAPPQPETGTADMVGEPRDAGTPAAETAGEQPPAATAPEPPPAAVDTPADTPVEVAALDPAAPVPRARPEAEATAEDRIADGFEEASEDHAPLKDAMAALIANRQSEQTAEPSASESGGNEDPIGALVATTADSATAPTNEGTEAAAAPEAATRAEPVVAAAEPEPAAPPAEPEVAAVETEPAAPPAEPEVAAVETEPAAPPPEPEVAAVEPETTAPPSEPEVAAVDPAPVTPPAEAEVAPEPAAEPAVAAATPTSDAEIPIEQLTTDPASEADAEPEAEAETAASDDTAPSETAAPEADAPEPAAPDAAVPEATAPDTPDAVALAAPASDEPAPLVASGDGELLEFPFVAVLDAGRLRGILQSQAIEVRIADIEPIPFGERCGTSGPGGAGWHCGAMARAKLSAMIDKRAVECRVRDDVVGRKKVRQVIATCTVGGDDLGLWVARNGWAEPAPGGGFAIEEATRLAEKEGRGQFAAAAPVTN